MRVDIQWHKPIRLQYGRHDAFIYSLPDLDVLPRDPGIYTFGRVRGGVFIPLYIGKAQKIRSRVRTQFNNLRLMRGIESAPGSRRYLSFGVIAPKPGQGARSAVDLAERTLIEYAVVQGYDILNVQGTKPKRHFVTSRGSKAARGWLLRQIAVRKR